MDEDKHQSTHLFKDDGSSHLNINNTWIMESAEQQGLMSLLITFLNVRQARIWGRKLWQSFYRPLFLAIVRFGRKSAPSTSETQYPEKASSKDHRVCFTQI